MDDINGQRFGRLTVVERVGSKLCGSKEKLRSLWLCRCDCGNLTRQPRISLTTGHTISCGCLRRDAPNRLKHGHAGHRSKTYLAWVNLRNRSYGRQLVAYDPRWDSFENFLADMGESPEGSQLDRIDANGSYCKENCRWTDQKTNTRNRTITFKVNGIPFAQIAEEAEVGYYRLFHQFVTKHLPLDIAIANAKALEAGRQACTV